MLKGWQFNILFFVGVGGAVFLVVGPEFGFDVTNNPTALAGLGSILAYVLTQKSSLTKHLKKKPPAEDISPDDEGDDAQSKKDNTTAEGSEDDE